MYHRAINMSLVIKRLLEVWSILTHITAVLTNSQNRYNIFFYLYLEATLSCCWLLHQQSKLSWTWKKYSLFAAFLSIRKPAAASIVAVYWETRTPRTAHKCTKQQYTHGGHIRSWQHAEHFLFFLLEVQKPPFLDWISTHIFGTEMPTVCLSS